MLDRGALKRRWRRTLFHLLQGVAVLTRRLFGMRALRWLGHRIGDLQFLLDGSRRRRYVRDLAAVLGEPGPTARAARTLRSAYHTGTRAALEILSFGAQRPTPADIEQLCRLDGLAGLQAVLDQSRPVILLNNHMGNSMAMQLLLAHRGYPVSVVYRESGKFPPGFFERVFAPHGIEGIRVDDGSRAYRRMLKALKTGRILCIIMDQGTKMPGGVAVRFLGKDMDMPVGPAQLARHAGAVIMPVPTLAEEVQWHFAIEPPVALDPEGTVDDDVRQLTRVMETQILERPHLWTWHHRRWRRYPLASDPLQNQRD